MSAPRIGGLFFGYGGLDMAARDVFGGELAWVSEIDKAACKLIEHRHPSVPNLGDITQVDWSQVEPVDILTGGSPCQDLSHAGRRAGMTEGTRSNLWVAMREAIAVLKPRLVIWENVRGANSACADSAMGRCPRCVDPSHPGGHAPVLRALGRVLGDLASLGYDAQWHGLRAADIGFCHGRFRYFVAAYPQLDSWWLEHGDGRTAANSDPLGLQRTGRARRRWSRSTDGGFLPTPTNRDHKGRNQRGSSGDLMLPSAVTLLQTPTAVDYKASGGSSPSDVTLTDAVVRTEMGTKPNERLLPTPMVASSSPESHGQISGQYRDQMADALTRWGEYTEAIHRHESVTGRIAPAPTQLSSKGNPQLAPAFSEWMMGLSAGHITDVPGLSRNDMLKLCGNGVIPQQAAYALRLMVGRAAVMAA